MNVEEQREAIREGLAKGFYYKATGNNRWDSESDVVKEPHYTNADAVLAFLRQRLLPSCSPHREEMTDWYKKLIWGWT